jgi:DNA repair photolyase
MKSNAEYQYELVKPFDPWKSELCTCGKKFSFNPYTGCVHGCLYCYATYIPNFSQLRMKKRLLLRLEKDLRKLPSKALISMSNSSDPYPPVEHKHRITRECLSVMGKYDVKLLVVTKSDMVARDADLLSKMKSAVSITITTLSKKAAALEPGAPIPQRRIEALKELKDAGIPVILRVDPILPFLTEADALRVVEACSFVEHVVTSTLKLRRDSFMKITAAFPELKEKYRRLYFEKGEKIKNSWYLPAEIRREMLERIKEKCREMGISCAFCREGFGFRSESCDGSHLIA